MAMTQQQRDQAMKNIARLEKHYEILGRPNPNARHMAMRKRSLQSGGNAVTNAGKGLLGGMGSDIGNMIGGLLGGRAKMVGDVVKGVGRDVRMGLGLLEKDQDFYDRTRETLRRQYGDERAEIYDRQMAARRAAAPSASSGLGASMSTTIRPQMRRVSQSADLSDFPLTMFQNAEIQRRSPDILGPNQGLDFFNTMMQTIPEDQLSSFSEQMYRDYLLRGGTLEFPEYILSGED
jgi:hypothetical protein